MFSDEHKFKQFKGGNPRHNFVWDTSPSQVPGHEMERWLKVDDAWEDSAHRARLSSRKAPAYQDIFAEEAAASREWVV